MIPPPPSAGPRGNNQTVRSSGVLLHPTSLPGPFGIGALGSEAHRFLEVLERMRQSWWQMLPIGPTGYGDSPYQSPSTFAGNPLLIDLGSVPETDRRLLLDSAPRFPDDRVDFGHLIPWSMEMLAGVTAFLAADRSPELETFIDRHDAVWLDDFALFTAIKRLHALAPWWEWPPELVHREPAALAEARDRLSASVDRVKVEQYLFDTQFQNIRRGALKRGIRLIGDIPIFVAHDSADVWANPDLFFLDENGLPTVVAGVPPDYFSRTGQRWGNPLYDWDRHRADGFAWWTARMGRMFDLFDLVRVDHFRGFAASWHIAATEPTAVSGEWVEAPGIELFDHLLGVFGELPVIAEDLGLITPDVEALRDRYSFPGMKILQFGFGTESAHAPVQFRPNVVAYTGTHDNDTAVGWFNDLRPDRVEERRTALDTLGTDGSEFHWVLIEGVMSSVADTTVIPLQDILGLGSEARMNTPATTLDNWRWRFSWDDLTPEIERRMAALTMATGRSGHVQPSSDGRANPLSYGPANRPWTSRVGMTWDPRRYLRFTDHRLRPGVELLARIDMEDPVTVVDAGCGPGNLTRLLTERWPAAAVTGIDASESMLARASQEQPGVDWICADFTAWSPPGPVDVLFSNAALHWVGDHAAVFPRLFSWVAPGGVLAVQMPDNWKQPTHTIPAAILDSGGWPSPAVEALVREPVHTPGFYRDLLRDQSGTIDIWVTTYHQVLAGDNPIFEWVEGTVLSPVLAELDQDERSEFRRQCTDAYEQAYPREPDGRVVLPFRRLFIVATRTVASA